MIYAKTGFLEGFIVAEEHGDCETDPQGFKASYTKVNKDFDYRIHWIGVESGVERRLREIC